jgi:hypothetical protein
MEGKHVLTALEGLQFSRLLPDASAKDRQILAANAERKRLRGHHPASARTEEENIQLMEQLRKDALAALRQRSLSRHSSTSDLPS